METSKNCPGDLLEPIDAACQKLVNATSLLTLVENELKAGNASGAIHSVHVVFGELSTLKEYNLLQVQNKVRDIIELVFKNFVEQVVRDSFTELEIIKEKYPQTDCPEWFRSLLFELFHESDNLAQWVDKIKQDIGLSRFCNLIEEGGGKADNPLKVLKKDIKNLACEYVMSDARKEVRNCMKDFFL